MFALLQRHNIPGQADGPAQITRQEAVFFPVLRKSGRGDGPQFLLKLPGQGPEGENERQALVRSGGGIEAACRREGQETQGVPEIPEAAETFLRLIPSAPAAGRRASITSSNCRSIPPSARPARTTSSRSRKAMARDA